jgi:hypothetical protein
VIAKLIPLAIVLATSGCVSLRSAGALTVAEVTSSIVQLDGKTVTVRGWLDVCQHLSCGLFPSKEAAIERQYGDQMLSIASTPDFDDQAEGRGPAEVLLVARVSADFRTKYICMDRAHELQPIAIRFLRKS